MLFVRLVNDENEQKQRTTMGDWIDAPNCIIESYKASAKTSTARRVREGLTYHDNQACEHPHDDIRS